MFNNIKFSISNEISTEENKEISFLNTIKSQLKYIYGMPKDIGAELSLGWTIPSEFINKPLTFLKKTFKTSISISLKNKTYLFKENHLYIPAIQPTTEIDDKLLMVAFYVTYINFEAKLNYKSSKKNLNNEILKTIQIIDLLSNNFFVVNKIEFEYDKNFKNYGFFNKYFYNKKEFNSLKTSIHFPFDYEGEICFKIIDLDIENLDISLHKLLKSQFNNYNEDVDFNEPIEKIKEKILILKLLDY